MSRRFGCRRILRARPRRGAGGGTDDRAGPGVKRRRKRGRRRSPALACLAACSGARSTAGGDLFWRAAQPRRTGSSRRLRRDRISGILWLGSFARAAARRPQADLRSPVAPVRPCRRSIRAARPSSRGRREAAKTSKPHSQALREHAAENVVRNRRAVFPTPIPAPGWQASATAVAAQQRRLRIARRAGDRSRIRMAPAFAALRGGARQRSSAAPGRPRLGSVPRAAGRARSGQSRSFSPSSALALPRGRQSAGRGRSLPAGDRAGADRPEAWYNLAVHPARGRRRRGVRRRAAAGRSSSLPTMPKRTTRSAVALSMKRRSGRRGARSSSGACHVLDAPLRHRLQQTSATPCATSAGSTQAAAAYQQALALSPSYARRLNGLGHPRGVAAAAGHRPAAASSRALELAPDQHEIALKPGGGARAPGPDARKAATAYRGFLAADRARTASSRRSARLSGMRLARLTSDPASTRGR
jgi:hypothetical protein